MSESKEITKQGEQKPERTSQDVVITPAVDIFENKDQILVVTDVPGVASDGVNLRFDQDQLFIEATARPIGEDINPLFREFGQVTYRRIFELAPGIDVEKITADLKAGVLTIALPKAEALKPRKIQITVG